jgi:hypothetical protein
MDLEISASSLQYVKVPVAAKLAGAVVNPTGDVVALAFPTPGAPPITWYTGAWETDSSASTPVYLARTTVGPGGTAVLAVGSYEIWVKVTDNPEIPVLRSAVRLKIF